MSFGQRFPIKKWSCTIPKEIPHQKNLSDCGTEHAISVFTAGYGKDQKTDYISIIYEKDFKINVLTIIAIKYI